MVEVSYLDRLALVQIKVEKYHLDPSLVCAVVEQESGWNRCACRYEPQFYLQYVAPLRIMSTNPTEAICRSMSWGLMQVMGQVAREHGYTGRYLSALCDIDTGLDIGCAVLRSKLDAVGGDVVKGLMRYNGGGNPQYATQVMARMSKYQGGEGENKNTNANANATVVTQAAPVVAPDDAGA